MVLQELRQNINQSFNVQDTPYISSSQVNYGVSVKQIFKKIDCIIKALYYIYSYHKTSNISGTLIGKKIVDNSDVVGASPVGATPTTSSFST